MKMFSRCKTSQDRQRITNNLENHLKDIHEVNDTQKYSHSIMSAAGVCWLEPKVCIKCTQWTGSWTRRKGPQHTHNSTILFLKDTHSPRNFDWPLEANWKSTNNANNTAQPGQHQKAHNDVPSHPHNNHTTNFLCGWR